jgi:hypothetical protein
MFLGHCRVLISVTTMWSLAGSISNAGPFAPAGGQPGATAISVADPSIVEWSAAAVIHRGLRRIDDLGSGSAYYGGLDGLPANSAPVGQPPQPQQTANAVALGQGGTATLTFDLPIADGPGPDFAVFANGFAVGNQGWIKPAFVEVSSDGVDFFRFPSVSLTQTITQVGSGGVLDPTNLYNLAGKDPVGYGTPFDLSELAGTSPLLNLNYVTHVRLVDCVGDIDPAYATYDSKGNTVNSPWPANSAVGSEGFDLAGIGVIHTVPEPRTFSLAIAVGSVGFWLSLRRSSILR